MGRSNQLSEREKGKLIAYSEMNLSKRDMARRLRRSVHVVTNFFGQGEKYGKNYKGRSKKLSAKEQHLLKRAASNTSNSCKTIIKETNLSISQPTASRYLKNFNIKYLKMKAKPVLTKKHKENRKLFCKKNLKQDWSKVWFSDEKRWCLDGPDRVGFYWHDLRKDTLLRMKRHSGGRSLTVWGAICGSKKSPLVILNETVTADRYINILSSSFLPAYDNSELLVADNAPAHSAKKSKSWIETVNIQTIKWPSVSPDLNPIENVWGLLVRRVYGRNKQFSNLKELETEILSAWDNLSPEDILSLTNSMDDRVFDCIVQNGSHTKY